MESRNIYTDIARRTGGDIYIGVVGPVRTGKSTFIKRFMEDLVIPNIESEFVKERAVDELPQSAAGRTIMTTEPKFIPEEAVKIELEQGAQLNVRLIDCVGYIVPSSLGYIENEQPRMVMTPWFEQEIPFNMAAEIGTQKVIQEHSTIGLVVTTDGSISDIPREEYAEAEERVIRELQELQKPFARRGAGAGRTDAAALRRAGAGGQLPGYDRGGYPQNPLQRPDGVPGQGDQGQFAALDPLAAEGALAENGALRRHLQCLRGDSPHQPRR